MNNFCGKGMKEYLPYGEFNWLQNVAKFDVNSTSENSSAVYILEVDLEYPDELHALRNDYPLAAEKFAISYDMLPDYKNCWQIWTKSWWCKIINPKFGQQS